MMKALNRTKRFLWMIGLVSLTLFSWIGCDVLTRGAPESARLVIEGIAGTEVDMTISFDFIAQSHLLIDDDTGLPIGDTLLVEFIEKQEQTITLPFEQTYDISTKQRILLVLKHPTPEQINLVSEAWIDDRLRYRKTAAAQDTSLRYIYIFLTNENGRVIEET